MKNLDSLTELSLSRRNILISDRQRVVVGDEEDMEDGCSGQVAGQQAGGVGQNRLGIQHRQAEEGDGPNSVEDLRYLGCIVVSRRTAIL